MWDGGIFLSLRVCYIVFSEHCARNVSILDFLVQPSKKFSSSGSQVCLRRPCCHLTTILREVLRRPSYGLLPKKTGFSLRIKLGLSHNCP